MDRRSFIRGAFAIVGATLIPKAAYSAPELKEIGQRMAAALAKSMMQTREQMAANVMTRAFWDHETDVFHLEGFTAEEVYRA